MQLRRDKICIELRDKNRPCKRSFKLPSTLLSSTMKFVHFSPPCDARNSLYGVSLHYKNNFSYMKLSKCLRLKLFSTIFRFLNLNGPLQLGGVSTPNLLYPKLTVTNYKGCIRNVISQGKYYDLKTPSYSNGTKEGCPMVDQHCRRHQCDSRSKCVPSWTGYSCSCPFGFSGPTCGRSKFKLNLQRFLTSFKSCPVVAVDLRIWKTTGWRFKCRVQHASPIKTKFIFSQPIRCKTQTNHGLVNATFPALKRHYVLS